MKVVVLPTEAFIIHADPRRVGPLLISTSQPPLAAAAAAKYQNIVSVPGYFTPPTAE